MKKSDIWKLLLTLYITFASYQIYWVFKEAEIQAIGLKLDATKKEERESKSEREKERWFCILRRFGIWGRKYHALWVWETASDADEWRDETVRTFFFLLLFLVSVQYAFTGRNVVFFLVWLKQFDMAGI